MSKSARAAAAGYSGTPLLKKLGYKAEQSALLVDAPAALKTILLGAGFRAVAESAAAKIPKGPFDVAHVFVSERTKLAAALKQLRERIAQDGMVWVSWPKKASKVATDITEDTIRAEALPIGFVDVKVCAVDEIWSGLKLMIRRELRRS